MPDGAPVPGAGPEQSAPVAEPSGVALVARLRAAGCVFAEDEAALLVEASTRPDGALDPGRLESLVQQREDGLPLEHLLGWAEFCGLRVLVDPGVFVPRLRTELLVHEALALLPAPSARPDDTPATGSSAQPGAGRVADPAGGAVRGPAATAGSGPIVVDLCCGSGAIGLAVATARPDVTLLAADLDPAAVACARRNLLPMGAQVLQGDLDAPLPPALRGQVDVLTANTPYVPTGALALMPQEARLHEHAVALDGGADGLDLQRRLAAVAARWLRPGGSVLVEAGEEQAPSAADVMRAHGLSARVVVDDERDATVVVGTRPVGPPD